MALIILRRNSNRPITVDMQQLSGFVITSCVFFRAIHTKQLLAASLKKT